MFSVMTATDPRLGRGCARVLFVFVQCQHFALSLCGEGRGGVLRIESVYTWPAQEEDFYMSNAEGAKL